MSLHRGTGQRGSLGLRRRNRHDAQVSVLQTESGKTESRLDLDFPPNSVSPRD